MSKIMRLSNFQYFSQELWTKIKNTFLTKEAVIDGILVGQEWELVETVTGNTTIALPDLKKFDEIYISMNHSDGTITHQVNLKIDDVFFKSSNNTHREILLDSINDAITYVTYNINANSIIATMCEGMVVTADSKNITTNVYVKGNKIENGNAGASKIMYDDKKTKLDAVNVQDAIEKVCKVVDDVDTVYEYAKSSGYTGSEDEFKKALININTQIITDSEVDAIISELK